MIDKNSWLAGLKRFVLEFFYPSLCWHCRSNARNGHFFCSACVAFFELMDPSCRCRFCFSESEQVISSEVPDRQVLTCPACVKHKRYRLKMAAALEGQGPVLTFFSSSKSGKFPYLSKTAAAFLAIQIDRLKWDLPDYFIPLPRRSFLSNDFSKSLAIELGKILGVTVIFNLKRRPGDLKGEKSIHFYLKNPDRLTDKKIVLIDDRILTGNSFRLAEECLRGFCKTTKALALCYA